MTSLRHISVRIPAAAPASRCLRPRTPRAAAEHGWSSPSSVRAIQEGIAPVADSLRTCPGPVSALDERTIARRRTGRRHSATRKRSSPRIARGRRRAQIRGELVRIPAGDTVLRVKTISGVLADHQRGDKRPSAGPRRLRLCHIQRQGISRPERRRPRIVASP